MAISTLSIPKEFIWRRLHSLTGLFFSLYLMLHLYVNSQSGLGDGESYIRSVNSIQETPFLRVLEVFLLGLPILLHTVLGIQYLFRGRQNAYRIEDAQPHLPKYERNHAYSWQRITAWILVLGVIGHVAHMRFMEYPILTKEKKFITRISDDPEVLSLARRFHVKLYDQRETEHLKQEVAPPHVLRPLPPNEVWAVGDSFGTVTLLMVRNSFKSPILVALYTVFVLAACYHGFNGLWSFMISWGVTLTTFSQRLLQAVSTFLMILIALMGLSAIFLNLQP